MTTFGGLKTIQQDILCRKLAKGLPLKEIYGSKGLTKVDTVYRWMQESPEFRNMYALAAWFRAERMAEQCAEIAEGLPPDVTDEATRAARLKIETKKWLVERLEAQARGIEGPDDRDEPPSYTEVRWVESVAPQIERQGADPAEPDDGPPADLCS